MRLLPWALPGLFIATTVAADPHLTVKARTFVDGLRASSEGNRVTVTGTLRDNLGQSVSHAILQVGAGASSQRARTGPSGRFSVELDLPGSGLRRLSVRFAGNNLLAPARAETPVRVGRRGVELSLSAPDMVEADTPVTVAVMAADAAGDPVGDLLLQARVDSAPVPPIRLGPAGSAVMPLPPLGPGTHTVQVHWPGDAHRLPASARIAFGAARSMALTLEAVDPAPPPGQPVVLNGALLRGPDQEVALRLTANGRPIDEQRAGPGFTFTVDPDDLEPGAVRFRVSARTDAEGWRDAMSAPVVVQVPPPPPPSPWWLWTPTLLAAISLFGVMGRAWWRRPRPEARPPAPVAVLPPAFTFDAPTGGPPGALEVHLRDGLTGAPLAGVVVWLAPQTALPAPAAVIPPAGARAEVAADGRARLVGAGDRIWAWAPGYAPVCHALPATAGRARLARLPIRARLQTLYDELLALAGRPPLRFGKETPREAASPLSARGAPPDPLVALTTLVERACFDANEPDHPTLVEAYALVAAVRAGLEAR